MPRDRRRESEDNIDSVLLKERLFAAISERKLELERHQDKTDDQLKELRRQVEKEQESRDEKVSELHGRIDDEANKREERDRELQQLISNIKENVTIDKGDQKKTNALNNFKLALLIGIAAVIGSTLITLGVNLLTSHFESKKPPQQQVEEVPFTE